MKLSYVLSYQHTIFEAVGLGDFEKNLLFLEEQGYDGVEIALRDPEQIDPIAFKQKLAKLGLALSAIGTGQGFVDEGISLTNPEDEIRQKAVQRVKKHINFASHFGSQVIIGLIRGKIVNSGLKKRQMGFFQGSIKELCSYAERKEVVLSIEPLNRYECNIFNTAEEVIEFIKQVNSPALKILLDTFHMNIEEKDMGKTIINSRSYLAHVHIADSNRKFPGLGHIDFGKVYQTLKEIDYGGYLSAEILPYPDLKTAIQQYILRMKEAMNG